MALGAPLTRPATRAQTRLRSSRPRTGGRSGVVALELALPVLLLGLWWLLSAGSTSVYFPPLADILVSLRSVWLFDHFSTDALPTLEHLALGYLLATLLGVVGGLALGGLPGLSDAVAPILEFLRAVPGVALLPAALLILGIGPANQIALIAYGAVWPILLSTIDGVRGVDGALHDVARSYRIGPADRLLRITLRAASPHIVAGMRTALAIGIAVIMFSEMVGSTNGIGYQILQAQRSFAVDDMWGGMVLLGVVGYLLNVAFRGFEHLALAWHRGMRATH